MAASANKAQNLIASGAPDVTNRPTPFQGEWSRSQKIEQAQGWSRSRLDRDRRNGMRRTGWTAARCSQSSGSRRTSFARLGTTENLPTAIAPPAAKGGRLNLPPQLAASDRG